MVPFEDLKYAMFKAEYTFMIAKAKARLGRDVDQGDFYSTAPTPSGAAAEPGRHALSAVLQTLKDEAHVLLLNRQKVGEMAAEMEKHMAAQVQEQVQAHMAKLGASMPTPEVNLIDGMMRDGVLRTVEIELQVARNRPPSTVS